jgi:hypothetical protein
MNYKQINKKNSLVSELDDGILFRYAHLYKPNNSILFSKLIDFKTVLSSVQKALGSRMSFSSISASASSKILPSLPLRNSTDSVSANRTFFNTTLEQYYSIFGSDAPLLSEQFTTFYQESLFNKIVAKNPKMGNSNKRCDLPLIRKVAETNTVLHFFQYVYPNEIPQYDRPIIKSSNALKAFLLDVESGKDEVVLFCLNLTKLNLNKKETALTALNASRAQCGQEFASVTEQEVPLLSFFDERQQEKAPFLYYLYKANRNIIPHFDPVFGWHFQLKYAHAFSASAGGHAINLNMVTISELSHAIATEPEFIVSPQTAPSCGGIGIGKRHYHESLKY